ncbi:uncharacterized protein LOC126999538 [Eriocheir sinensis]|uniref:uncharacterized protein LOC126999538 n=1 Tax=Eriocheir sinensis TaxID=95602 RepID=UPI0021C972E8|nr:uncharacterized protein LOC126999538 [Eriocheir sinensis]
MKVTTFYFNNLGLLEVKSLLSPNQHLTAFDDAIRTGDQAEGKYFLFELETFWGKERIGDSWHARVTLHDVLEECIYEQTKVHGLLYGTFCEAVEEHLLKDLRYKTTWTKKNYRYSTIWLVVHRMRVNPYVWNNKDYNPLMVVLDPIHPSQCEMWLMVEKGCRGDEENREEALAIYDQMTDSDVSKRKPKYIYRWRKICSRRDRTVRWQTPGLSPIRPVPDQAAQPPRPRVDTSDVLNLETPSSSQTSPVLLAAAERAQEQDSAPSTSWRIVPPRLKTNSKQASSSKKRKSFTGEESVCAKKDKQRHEPLQRVSSAPSPPSSDGVTRKSSNLPEPLQRVSSTPSPPSSDGVTHKSSNLPEPLQRVSSTPSPPSDGVTHKSSNLPEPLQRVSSTPSPPSSDCVTHKSSNLPASSRCVHRGGKRRRKLPYITSDTKDKGGGRAGGRNSRCRHDGSGRGCGGGWPSSENLLVMFCFVLFLFLVCFFFFVLGAATYFLVSMLNGGVCSCCY